MQFCFEKIADETLVSLPDDEKHDHSVKYTKANATQQIRVYTYTLLSQQCSPIKAAKLCLAVKKKEFLIDRLQNLLFCA